MRQWSTGVLGRLTNFERFRDQHTLRARRVIVARWFGRRLRTFIYASRYLDHRCRKRCMENNGSDQMPPTISDKLGATRVKEFSQKSDRDKSSPPEDSSRTWRAGNAKSMRNVCPLCASFRSACALAPFFGRASRERLFSAREVNTDCCKAQIGSQQRQGF